MLASQELQVQRKSGVVVMWSRAGRKRVNQVKEKGRVSVNPA